MTQNEVGADSAAGGGLAAEPNLDLPAGMFSARDDDKVEETTIRMQRRFFGLVNVDVEFTERDGTALMEGDIILGPADVVRGIGDPGPRGIGVLPEFRWLSATIPYVIVDEEVRERAKLAIKHWEERTPFRFVEHSDEPDHIAFIFSTRCASAVGRRGGEQVIELGDGCTVGSAIHEIGHAIGLWHEQSRSDRDEHITVVKEKIHQQARHNFDKHIQDAEDLGEYDFDSIMHYPADAFSIDGQPTIIAKNGQPIGQRKGLSKGDVASIKLMYPDLDWSAV